MTRFREEADGEIVSPDTIVPDGANVNGGTSATGIEFPNCTLRMLGLKLSKGNYRVPSKIVPAIKALIFDVCNSTIIVGQKLDDSIPASNAHPMLEYLLKTPAPCHRRTP